MPPELGDSLPFWDGSSLEGKTILVCSEQGFGDIIQFARYLPLLVQRQARVTFLAPAVRGLLVSGSSMTEPSWI